MIRFRGSTIAVIAVGVAMATCPAVADYRIFLEDSSGQVDPMALPMGESVLEVKIEATGAATTQGTPCVDGNGAEICGWSFDVDVVGGMALQAFVPDSTAGAIWNMSADRLRANGGLTGSPTLGPIPAGTLRVARTGEGMLVINPSRANRVVTASAQSAPLFSGLIAVPEPLFSTALAFGAAALGVGALLRRPPQRRRT